MPGGGKKAVFPTMALHDHEKNRMTANSQERMKKFHQSRGKSESRESPEKEKCDMTPTTPSPPKQKAKVPPKQDQPTAVVAGAK